MQIFFHNSNVFGSCIIHILYTGCAKVLKNNSGAKRLIFHLYSLSFWLKYVFFILCAQAGKAVVSFSKVGEPAGQARMLVGRAELHSNMGSEQWRGSYYIWYCER
jgi:hypothetical protein